MDREHKLLRAWRDGDAAAGKTLFGMLFDDLFGFFRNKCDDPEDLIQKTLLACLEAVDGFEERCSFRVFVFSIAKNQIYSHWRAKSRRRPEEDVGALSLEALGPTPSRVMRELEAHQQLNAGLRSIPLDDQILLESYYWQRLSGPELAGMMGLTEPAVRSRLRRALERLRNAVETMTAHQDTAATLESLDAWSAELRALERVGSAKAPA